MAHSKAKRAGQADQSAAGRNIVPLFQAPARGSERATGTRLSGLNDLPRVELAGRPGLLPAQQIEALKSRRKIDARDEILADQIQPASLDLRLGSRAYRIRASFLPGRHQTVPQRLEKLKQHEFSLDDGAVLEQGCVYLVKLQERLSLPPSISAVANPKSSTGRIDVFTRVITDRSYRFDEIADGYEGQLYLEVVPLSFPVRVGMDLTLNQVRLSFGRAAMSDDDVRAYHAHTPLLYDGDEAVPVDKLALGNGMFLGLDLRGDASGRVGYRAREHAPTLDLTKTGAVEPGPYWEDVLREEGNRTVLSPRKFYLLMSNEAVSVPPDLAAEMTAYDPTSGELRTHYAGFFDPGFGYDRDGRFHGSRAALEVRAHDVPFNIEDGQRVCKLTFERMLAEPDTFYGDTGIKSNYQGQQDALGKHFLRPSRREATRQRRGVAQVPRELAAGGPHGT
jgi:dCTP deaminase